ncbi:lysostaphin resistance A-like protein [Avrilella dinanensis]|uniref:CPBP family intramembrane glutamic endopeptidase n=1 Tax=Avrilella dinanensis TaxID=2008672 RepID=UPI003C6C2620
MRVIIFFLYVALVTFAGYLDSEFSTRIIAIILLISSVYVFYTQKQEFKEKLTTKKFSLLILLALSSAFFFILLNYNATNSEYYNSLYTLNFVDTLLLCVIIPVIEEVVFRLYWLRYLNRVLSETKVILITSLGFSIIHFYSGVPLLFPFLYGILFAWLYLKFRNIYLCIVLHVLYNTIAVFIYTAIQNIEVTNQIKVIGLITAGVLMILSLRQLYIRSKTL